jgi:hypothetical protein
LRFSLTLTGFHLSLSLGGLYIRPKLDLIIDINNRFKMYQIGNIYVITAIAVIGGGLFGFDISSMSAMYVSCIFAAFNHI